MPELRSHADPSNTVAGDADMVQVLWWNGQRWAAPGPFGLPTMPLDAALDYIASEPHFWSIA